MSDTQRYSRHPDTIVILGLCAVIGALQVLTAEIPASVLALVPFGVGVFWAVAFALAAGAVVLGAFWRDPVEGWLIELVARIVLFTTAGSYTYALGSAITRPGSLLIVGFMAGVTISSLARVVQITRRVRQYRADLTRRLP